MYQGRLSKAQRGDLQFALPVGYVWSPTGEIQFDPDEQVQQVVRFIFRKFEELGTLGGLVRYLASHQIQLGVRVREGPGKGELVWRRPNRATVQMMLKHPLYAGSYVYGRRQEDPRRKQPQRPRTGRVVMTTDEWLVLLPNRCPAYISPEQYERNQARLQANRARADAQGAARSGSALLAGLVVCARCGCRLNVHYDGGTDEVERAARQYQAVEPEHRLVARTLEHAWEEKLAAQQQLEQEYHRFVQHKPRLPSARQAGGHSPPGNGYSYALGRFNRHRSRSQGDHSPGRRTGRGGRARLQRACEGTYSGLGEATARVSSFGRLAS